MKHVKCLFWSNRKQTSKSISIILTGNSWEAVLKSTEFNIFHTIWFERMVYFWQVLNETCRMKSFWWNITILSLDLVTFNCRSICKTWLPPGPWEKRKIMIISVFTVFTASGHDEQWIFGEFLKRKHVFQSRPKDLES